MTRYVQRLSAPATGWTATADVIVVGSGIAGLTAALELRRLVGKVLIVTKGPLSSGNTVWAQGGIAAALDPEDTAEEHLQDTLVAGAGLCSEQAVRALVTEGPERVRKLVDRGVRFAVKPEKRRIGGLIAIFLDQDDNQIAVVEEDVLQVPRETKVAAADDTSIVRPKRPVTEY